MVEPQLVNPPVTQGLHEGDRVGRGAQHHRGPAVLEVAHVVNEHAQHRRPRAGIPRAALVRYDAPASTAGPRAEIAHALLSSVPSVQASCSKPRAATFRRSSDNRLDTFHRCRGFGSWEYHQ